MLQSAKNRKQAASTKEQPLVFKSEVGLFLVYLLVRTLPIVAVVFYFFNGWLALATAVLLVLGLIWTARQHNHQFIVEEEQLIITPSFWPLAKPLSYPYTIIATAQIKLAHQGDQRQWLTLETTTGSRQRFRCDWLHQQDPPSVDEHDDHGPQHELFDLLDEEDFYEGSLQQLAFLLQEKGVLVQAAVS